MAMLDETSYTYAVARIRANELNLLSGADMEQILSAHDLAAAESMLAARGYAVNQGLDAALNTKAMGTWQLITEILPRGEDASPGTGEMDFLIVKNDFHNLKARLKSMFMGGRPEAYLLLPTVFDDQEIGELLQAKRFSGLPECMASCAQEAYELLARTMDGQLADAVIDRRCLETMLAMAKATGSNFIIVLAELICAFANAKIEMRAAKTGKDQSFLDKALCGCPPADIPEEARQSCAAFEKYCDDTLLEYASSAKTKHFGMEPLIAFFLAREAEVKNVRIILSCKRNEIPAEEIRKRVRLLYV